MRYRRHARASDDRSLRALQRRDFPFSYRKCRIAVTRVDVRLALSFCPKLHFLRRGKCKRRRPANVRHHRATDSVAIRFARMNRRRLRAVLGEARLVFFSISFCGWLVFHRGTILPERSFPTSTNLAAPALKYDDCASRKYSERTLVSCCSAFAADALSAGG